MVAAGWEFYAFWCYGPFVGKCIGRSSGWKSSASQDPNHIRFVLAGIGGNRGEGRWWFGWVVRLYELRRDPKLFLPWLSLMEVCGVDVDRWEGWASGFGSFDLCPDSGWPYRAGKGAGEVVTATVVTVPAGQWCCVFCSPLFGPIDTWVRRVSLGPSWYIFSFYVLLYFYYSVFGGFMPVISSYQILVRLGGLRPGLRTLCAWFALVSWLALVKWSQPPRGRMKRRSTRSFGWLHSEKAELIGKLWLYFGMIFPVCHLYCKVVGITSDAIPANWCFLEYMILVKTFAIIAICSLYAYCNLGFKRYVPPCIRLFH